MKNEHNVIRSSLDQLLLDGRLYSEVYSLDYMRDVLDSQSRVSENEVKRMKDELKNDYDNCHNSIFRVGKVHPILLNLFKKYLDAEGNIR